MAKGWRRDPESEREISEKSKKTAVFFSLLFCKKRGLKQKHDKIRYDCWVSHTTRLACYAIPRCPGPSHPDTKVRCTGDDDSPLKT